MANKLMAAAVMAIAASVGASAAMAAEGPKLSTETFIAPAAPGIGVSDYDPSRSGPKISSENRIAPIPGAVVASAQPTGAQHWVYEQGYEKGTWRSHAVLAP
jgi:hypothetical protein